MRVQPREAERIIETDVEMQLVPAPTQGEYSPFGNSIVVVVDDENKEIAWKGAKKSWLDGQESENTRRAYAIAYKGFFDWVGRQPWEIGSALAQQWKVYMKSDEYVRKRDENGVPIKWGRLADSSINAKLAALSAFYKFILTDYFYVASDGRDLSLWDGHSNPFSAVKRKKVSPYGRAVFPTTDEVRRILDEINTTHRRGKFDFALLFTYATTCRRFFEIINLRWGDISAGKNGNYVISYIGKGGDPQKSELQLMAHTAIVEYLTADGRMETILDEDYIFIALDPTRIQRLQPDLTVRPNRPICNKTANDILRKYARRAGVDEKAAHIHGLRHAGIRQEVDRQLEAGGAPNLVKLIKISKHASYDTLQIYMKNALTSPEDVGVDERAMELMPKGKRRRRRQEPASTQGRLL